MAIDFDIIFLPQSQSSRHKTKWNDPSLTTKSNNHTSADGEINDLLVCESRRNHITIDNNFNASQVTKIAGFEEERAKLALKLWVEITVPVGIQRPTPNREISISKPWHSLMARERTEKLITMFYFGNKIRVFQSSENGASERGKIEKSKWKQHGAI